ncbi:MAG: hypothetical protein WDW38_008807 [Sanguina aurantia]
MAARSGATLSLVGDEIYLFGGTEPVSGVCYNDLKVLDTATWTWKDIEVEGLLPPPRHSHSSGCLAGTCLLVYGGAGYSGPLSDVWVFNTLTRSWSRPTVRGSHPAAREMHTGLMLDSTRMLVYGGRGANNKVLCDVAILDATKMTWTQREPTPFARCAHSSVLISRPLASTQATPPSLPATSPALPSPIPPTQRSDPTPKAPATSHLDEARVVGDGAAASTAAASREAHPAAAAGASHNGHSNGDDSAPLQQAVSVAAVNEQSPAAPAAADSAATAAGAGPVSAVPTSQELQPGSSTRNESPAITSPPPASGRQVVLVYGGFGGEAVEGDVIQIDPVTLDVEVLTRGPRASNATAGVVVPCVRFAHSAVSIPWRSARGSDASLCGALPGDAGAKTGSDEHTAAGGGNGAGCAKVQQRRFTPGGRPWSFSVAWSRGAI